MIETWVAVFPRMGLIEARLWVIKRQTISHTVIVHVVGRRHRERLATSQDISTEFCEYTIVRVLPSIGSNGAKDRLCRSRWQHVLVPSIEEVRIILEVNKLILCLATFNQGEQFAERISSLLGIFCVIFIGTCLGVEHVHSLIDILHQRRSSPEIVLTQIGKGGNLIDTEAVLTKGIATYRRLIPIDRQQIGSLTEILGSLVGTCLVRFTRKCHRLIGSNRSIQIGKTTEILHQHEVEPATEEEELSLDSVLLFLRSSRHKIHVLKTYVTLTDAIPGSRPKSTFETVVRIECLTRLHKA